MNRGGLAGAHLGARRPVHRLRRRPPRRRQPRRRQDAAAHRPRRSPARCRRSPPAPRPSARSTTGGMMAMVEPIPYTKDASGRGGVGRRSRRPAQGGRRVRRARRLVGVHLAEDPGDGRHRRGRGDDHPAAADPRRRRRVPTRRPRSRRGSGRSSEPTVRGLVVGRALLYPPDGDVEGAVGAGRRARASARGVDGDGDDAPVAPPAGIPGTSAPVRRGRRRRPPGGPTAACASCRSPPAARYELVTGGAEMAVAAAVAAAPSRSTSRAGASSSTGGRRCSPRSPTGRTCRSTPRSGCPARDGAELALPSARATRRFDPALRRRRRRRASRSAAPVRRPARSPTSCRRRRSTAPTS